MTDKFFVEAVAGWEFFKDGRVSPYQIVTVRVRDSQGEPVMGLRKSNFEIVETGTFFSGKSITLCLNLKDVLLDGSYNLRVESSIQLKGQFSYAVIVRKRGRGRYESGGGEGQAFFSIVKLHD